jgi:hypothetical protein
MNSVIKFEIIQTDHFNEFFNISYRTEIGHNKISPVFLNICVFLFTPNITFMFNKSLSSGIYPNQWKSSFITLTFKKGNKSLINNYRPISKLSIIPKIFSKIVIISLHPCATIYYQIPNMVFGKIDQQ